MGEGKTDASQSALTLTLPTDAEGTRGDEARMSQAFISVEGLTRRFPEASGGGELTVFEDLWFAVEEGEFACVIGHSGCGKSTILNILAGLDEPTDGHIIAAGKHVAGPEPRPRRDLPGPRADAVAVGARQRRARRLLAPSRLVARARSASTP